MKNELQFTKLGLFKKKLIRSDASLSSQPGLIVVNGSDANEHLAESARKDHLYERLQKSGALDERKAA